MEDPDSLNCILKILTEISDLVNLTKNRHEWLQDSARGSKLEQVRVLVMASRDALQKVGDIMRPQIPWITTMTSECEYHSGSDPWEFFLKYPTSDNSLIEIHEALKMKFDEDQLKPFVNPPNEGAFVACLESKRFFRAMVQKFNCKSGRLRVLKIDSNEEGFVPLNNTYELPTCVESIPCQVLRCCLVVGEQSLKDAWMKNRKGLDTIFKNALSHTLAVKETKNVEGTFPPVFLINLYLYDDERLLTRNISTWLNNTLLAKLKASDAVDVLLDLDESCFDPFYECEETQGPPHQVNVTAEEPAENTKALNDLAAEHQSLDNDEAHAKVSNWMQNYTDEKTLKANRKVPPSIVKKKIREPSFSPPRVKTGELSQASSVNGNAYPSNRSESTVTSKSNSQAPGSIKNSANHAMNISKRGNTHVMSASAREFIPNCRTEIVRNNCSDAEDISDIVANLDDEYQPQDEKRLCMIFQKTGSCNRRGCTKDHKLRSTAWTDDQLPVYNMTFNDIDLPREQSDALLRIEHVLDGRTFFATIPNHYSDINEFGALETLDSLSADLNNSENASMLQLLPALPAISELVLALGLQRSLGPKKKWLRARVVDVLDENSVEVFFCDFGNKEVVKKRDLREMRPQFLHLPQQAVRVRLGNVLPVLGKEKEARRWLEIKIKGKVLRAKVIFTNVVDAELDVVLFDEKNKSINDEMTALELLIAKN